MATLTATDVSSADITPGEASAIPKSPACYPGLVHPGQSTPAPPDAFTGAVESFADLSSDATGKATLSPDTVTKGTLTAA